jgi:PAS domain S-box-containing protein
MSNRSVLLVVSYVWAVFAVVVATGLNLAFRQWITPTTTPILLVSVIVAAWVGGLGPGLIAALLATASMKYFFIDAPGKSPLDFGDIVRGFLFLTAAAFINSLVEARRRAEQAEHRQRLWYQAVLTSVGQGVVGTDEEGRVAFVNAAAEELTGWSKSEAMGRPIDEVLTIRTEMVGGPVLGPAERAMRLGKPVSLGPSHSVALVNRSGNRLPVDGLAAPIRTSEGHDAGVVFVFRDETSSRRASEAVAELAAIVASSQDAIIVRGTDDRITSWNPGAELMFGYSATEAVGRPMAILAPADRTDEMPRMLMKIANGLPISHFETQRVRRDGRRIDVSMSVSTLKDSEGRTIGVSTIARDVTERRQAERRLAVQYAVSRILSEAASLEEALPRLLETIGGGLQWEVGISWAIDVRSRRLKLDRSWHTKGQVFERFVRACSTKTMARNEGLPGRVWASGEPVWVADIATDKTFNRSAMALDAGLRAGVGFAIQSGDGVLCVLEFFTSEVLTPDEPMLGLLRVIGSQVGQFVEKKRAEADLRVAEARFRCLADSGILGIVVVDIEGGEVVEANDTFLAMLGATREEYRAGRVDPRAMTLPEYRDADARAIESVKHRGVCTPYIKEYLRSDGRRVSVLIGAAKLEASSPHSIAFLIDVTERRHAEETLRHREEQLRLALDVGGMATWDWQIGTGEVEWSDNLETVHGVAPGTFDAKSNSFLAAVHPDDVAAVTEGIDGTFSGESDFSHEFRVQAHDGSIRWINSRGRVFREEGRAVRMIGVNLNITDQKRAQEDLQAAKEVAVAANLAKNQFLAVLSHELRTPLTPVLAAVTAMYDDPSTPADFRAVMQMIARNVALEARLIDDLLDVTRISQGKLRLQTEVIDAQELLYQALDICMTEIREKDLQIDVGFEARECHVLADPARLQQVFWNLIKNAVKFTQIGGRLSIRTHNHAGRLVVRVADNGRGIEPALLPKIFNAFEQGEASITRRFGGLGLGLAISRSVIDALGGRISAESEGRDRGATFVIELDTVAPPAEKHEANSVPANDRLEGPFRILLVEDSDDALKIISRLLRLKGHTVAAANSVAAASEAVLTHDFDVLVSDLGLPDGSGHDVIRIVRERSSIPAIALSGFGMEEDLRHTRESGFVAHLIKPIDIQQLEGTIQAVMARHRNEPHSVNAVD